MIADHEIVGSGKHVMLTWKVWWGLLYINILSLCNYVQYRSNDESLSNIMNLGQRKHGVQNTP